jgi:CHAD domain-containing protein
MSDAASNLAHPGAAALTPDSPLWSWAYQAISDRAGTMLEHVEGVRHGEDIEAVHDMRVGSRRLVAALRVFEACYPDVVFRRLFREARRVTRALGGVRDLDVLIDHYRKLCEQAEPEEQPAIAYFIAIRQRERRAARQPMLASLDELVRTEYAERLKAYLREEAESYSVGLVGSATHCEDAFRSAAPAALETRLDELLSFEPYVAQADAVEPLHEMRIAAKWLRYTMELFAPAYADALKPWINSVKKLQELLGDLHDSDVRLDLLERMRAAPLDARGFDTLGLVLPEIVEAGLDRLHAREAEARKGYYRAFHKEWKKLERRHFADECRRRVGQPDAPAAPAPEGDTG